MYHQMLEGLWCLQVQRVIDTSQLFTLLPLRVDPLSKMIIHQVSLRVIEAVARIVECPPNTVGCMYLPGYALLKCVLTKSHTSLASLLVWKAKRWLFPGTLLRLVKNWPWQHFLSLWNFMVSDTGFPPKLPPATQKKEDLFMSTSRSLKQRLGS